MDRKLLRTYTRVAAISFELSFKMALVDAFIIFGIFLQPLVIAALALWMLQGSRSDYAIFVVVGSGLTGLWSTLLFAGGNSINIERWVGTLEMTVGAPTPVWVMVIGRDLANVLQSLGSMISSYLFIAIFFGVQLTIAQPVLFFASLIFTVISFVSFGLLLAPLFVLNPDVQRWQNGLEFPVYILGGFLFPIALLPGWTTPISYALAPYWAARALHGTSGLGGDLNEVWLSWGMMVALSLIYLLIARVMFKRLVYRARVDATLNVQ
jgi:ABC-2 type transport system permease protein